MHRKALCLVGSEIIIVLKEYNIARHYNSKHNEKFLGALREKKWQL
jgi:hypothetical protein